MVSIEFINPSGEVLSSYDQHIPWISDVVHQLGTKKASITYVIGDDEWLVGLNKEHLNHDYYTDVITFNLSESENLLESDICISDERIKENAKLNNQSYINEFKRVLIHGILHLHGYDDQTEADKTEMRKQENKYLNVSRGTQK
jgi:rRNA maturation RNase YbeY